MWPFKRKPHIHAGYRWDGFYEYCKCGACAGDYIKPNGFRALFFEEWPDERRGK